MMEGITWKLLLKSFGLGALTTGIVTLGRLGVYGIVKLSHRKKRKELFNEIKALSGAVAVDQYGREWAYKDGYAYGVDSISL